MRSLKVLAVLLPFVAVALASLVSMDVVESPRMIKLLLWGAAMCSAGGPFLPRLSEAIGGRRVRATDVIGHAAIAELPIREEEDTTP